MPLNGRHSGLSTHNNDFVINEGLFLVTSFFSGEWFVFLDGLEHILLPSLTLSLGVFGLVFRTARSSMIDAMSEPFFKTFLAYGFEPSEIICQSAYKNTLVTGISWNVKGGVEIFFYKKSNSILCSQNQYTIFNSVVTQIKMAAVSHFMTSR